MALTWHSVSPSNPAGILQASNMAGANIARGLDVIGSSIQEGAENYKDAETGKLLLMLDNAKSRNERQNILENADMAYIDQDIVAKDNQEFEAKEQQKEVQAFNRKMQEQEAKRDIDYKAFMQTQTLSDQERDIARDAATADYRQTNLENIAKDRQLKIEKDTAAIKSLDKWRDKQYLQTEAANKATKELQDYKRSIIKRKADQDKIVWDENRELKKAGEDLVMETVPKIDGTNDINSLVDINKTLKNKQLEDNPKAADLIKKVNTKIGSIVNISNLFPTKPGVPAPTMAITGKTQAEKNRSHNSNLQKTIDRLSVYLPDSNEDDLKSIADTILRKSSPEYGKAMNALKIPSEDLNNALALKLKGELQELRESGGELTLDEINAHRTRINTFEINKDTATGIEKARNRLNEEYSKVFAKTPLTNIISDTRTLSNYMTLGESALANENGVIDKRAVKKRHKSNIQNIINLIPATHRNKLNYEEIQQKVSNSLTRQPGYADKLEAAGVDYTADIQNLVNKKNLEWQGMRTTIDDDSTIEAIHKVHTWGDRNLIGPNRDAELNKLTERVNKKLFKDKEFSNMEITAYAIYTTSKDKAGKVTEGFDAGEYKKFREVIKEQIDEKYKDLASVSAVDKVLDNIIANHPEIVRVKTAHDDMLAFDKQYTQENNLAIIKRKIEASDFADVFSRTPVVALAGHDLKVHNTIAVISGVESVADRADTFKDSVDFSRYVYDTLRQEYGSTISVGELGNRAKKAIASLPPEAENVGDEYTRQNYYGGWIYTTDQIKKAAEATQ